MHLNSSIDSNLYIAAPALSAPIYTWGATQRIKGKSCPHLVSSPGTFKATTGTLEDLARHIGAGYAWMPSLLEPGARRWQSMANHAALLALDIDDGLTIAQALNHPLISKHCGLGIESNSSTPQHHKFRLVFPLSQPLGHHTDIKLCTLYLQELVGSADPACKDASRFYYGAEGRTPFLLNPGASLPDDFLQQARDWQAAIEAEKAEQRRIAAEKRERERQRIQAAGDVDLVDLVEQAEERLGQDAFIPYLDCESRGTAEKIRCKPAFRQGSGSKSAFIAENGGKWWYHDPASGDKALSGFWFWARVLGKGDRLAGAEWAKAAKEFCALAGIDVPDREWQPTQAGEPKDTSLKGRVLHFFTGIRQKAKGFKPEAPKASPKTQGGMEFAPGGRIEAYAELQRAGYKIILDGSGTGTGKSHDAGTLRPADLGLAKLIYVSADHRNPTTDTLKDWADLEARHGGLTQETAPDGSIVLRRTKPGDSYSVEPNCSRIGTIAALREANIDGAGSAALVCGGCPMREPCASSYGGNGFGYLGAKRRVLGRNRFRAHPDSLPHPDDFDYSEAALIIDEAVAVRSEKQLTVEIADLTRTMADLRDFKGVGDTLSALYELMSGDLPRYGLAHDEVTASVPMPAVGVLAVATALNPDLSFLNPTADYGGDLADLPKALRKHFAADSEEDAKRLAKQWLPQFLDVLGGKIPGATVRIDRAGLHITTLDPSLRQKIAAAALVIIQDATTALEDLALALGVGHESIARCYQKEAATPNLQRIQVADVGAMTRQRGADQERRAAAIVSHYQDLDPTTKVIDFKTFNADGSWWTDSRGSNAFQDCKTLVLVGSPFENLGDALATYCAELGTVVSLDDEGFKAWLERKVAATICQGEGRLRANRRSDEALTVVLLSNFTMPGYEQVEGQSITPDAGTKPQRAIAAMKKAGLEIMESGAKLTQAAIAAATGFSQGWVSQLMAQFQGGWSGFKKLLFSLLGTYSESNKFSPGLEAEEVEVLAEMLTVAPPHEIPPLLLEFAKDFGSETLTYLCSLLDEAPRMRILGAILTA